MSHTVIIEALFQVVVFAFVLERALAFVFEVRWAGPGKRKPDQPPGPMLAEVLGSTLKAAITLGSACSLCFAFRFEALTPILTGQPAPSAPDPVNVAITALVVAGGSAAAIKLFQDVLGMGKVARDASREAQEAEAQTRQLKARAEQADLHARIASAEASTAMNRADVEALTRDGGGPA